MEASSVRFDQSANGLQTLAYDTLRTSAPCFVGHRLEAAVCASNDIFLSYYVREATYALGNELWMLDNVRLCVETRPAIFHVVPGLGGFDEIANRPLNHRALTGLPWTAAGYVQCPAHERELGGGEA
jgi:hypothetical protein